MCERSPHRVTWKESPLWLRCLAVVVFANFFSFWIVAVLLGGDAVNGRIDHGHYLLRSHAHLQEVSPAVFRYSEIHCVSAMAGMLVLVVAVALFNRRKSR